jgi:hypothetical protein
MPLTEKRKVDSSILSLTSTGGACRALTSGNASLGHGLPNRFRCPCCPFMTALAERCCT